MLISLRAYQLTIMKIKPEIYAQVLLDGIVKTLSVSNSHAQRGDKADFKDLAEKLWHILQKNKQFKDLPRIMLSLEKLYAEKLGKLYAKVTSEKALTLELESEISAKIEKKFRKQAYIKSIIKRNFSGILVQVDDSVLDLSLSGKIEKLERTLI